MKIKLELFGASRDFSNKEFLEFDIKQKIEIKDLRKEVINYLDKNFKGNENFIKIIFIFINKMIHYFYLLICKFGNLSSF